jgi:hypothetical protein
MDDATFDRLSRWFWYGAVLVSGTMTAWLAVMAF